MDHIEYISPSLAVIYKADVSLLTGVNCFDTFTIPSILGLPWNTIDDDDDDVAAYEHWFPDSKINAHDDDDNRIFEIDVNLNTILLLLLLSCWFINLIKGEWCNWWCGLYAYDINADNESNAIIIDMQWWWNLFIMIIIVIVDVFWRTFA